MCRFELRLRHFLMVLFIVTITVSHLSRAADSLSTLEKVRQTKTLKVGYGNTAPFSYVSPDGKVIGYSIDLCQRVAEAIRIQLGLDTLNIDYVFRTPANRVQMLNSGDIDLECVASSNTAERRRNAAFSISHFVVNTRFVSLVKNHLNTLDDLRGRSVSIVLGTVNIGPINQVNRDKKLNLSIAITDSLQKAFDMVSQEKVSAFAMDDILLHTMIANSSNPQDYVISNETVGEETEYGLMMRLDDKDFHNAVNTALKQIYASNEIDAIYARWFTQPLPGSQINLNYPMSERMKHTFTTASTATR
ncbi:amino acid ABC transporter substrate-binding protein [Edaphovirga cremea]|uniref:amino acid ABC transporter substrate-binding protein n=1 Tax=Edaphovirga cremea TaxID=2267246 RepID=UPI001B85FA00|nr:amino acid ABC transporter substrate-binding protein [Edaphovirga cremea]